MSDQPQQYLCVSDTYDPGHNRLPYASVAEFLDMCRTCFGEEPKLRETADGEWYDEEGRQVLVPWAEEVRS